MPNAPNCLRPSMTFRNLPFAIDAVGVDRFAQEPLELVEKRLGSGDFVRSCSG